MLRDCARLQRRGRPGFAPGSLFVGSQTGLPTTNARSIARHHNARLSSCKETRRKISRKGAKAQRSGEMLQLCTFAPLRETLDRNHKSNRRRPSAAFSSSIAASSASLLEIPLAIVRRLPLRGTTTRFFQIVEPDDICSSSRNSLISSAANCRSRPCRTGHRATSIHCDPPRLRSDRTKDLEPPR